MKRHDLMELKELYEQQKEWNDRVRKEYFGRLQDIKKRGRQRMTYLRQLEPSYS